MLVDREPWRRIWRRERPKSRSQRVPLLPRPLSKGLLDRRAPPVLLPMPLSTTLLAVLPGGLPALPAGRGFGVQAGGGLCSMAMTFLISVGSVDGGGLAAWRAGGCGSAAMMDAMMVTIGGMRSEGGCFPVVAQTRLVPNHARPKLQAKRSEARLSQARRVSTRFRAPVPSRQGGGPSHLHSSLHTPPPLPSTPSHTRHLAKYSPIARRCSAFAKKHRLSSPVDSLRVPSIFRSSPVPAPLARGQFPSSVNRQKVKAACAFKSLVGRLG